MARRLILLALFFVLLISTGADAGKGKVALVDGGGLNQGTATVKLNKGSIAVNALMAPLPAMVDTGDGVFEAAHYRVYLASSVDEAAEVSLGGVYPKTNGKTKLKVALKGDLSGLGLDSVLVVAFSKDGLQSFDVLTGTIETQ